MGSMCYAITGKITSSSSSKLFFAGELAENEIKVPFEQLNHLFIAFIPVADWAGHEAENEFPILGTS